MFNSVDLILKAINLLYREEDIDYKYGKSSKLVENVMDTIDKGNNVGVMGKNDDKIMSLKRLVYELAEIPADEKMPHKYITMQTIDSIIGEDSTGSKTLEKNLMTTMDDATIKGQILSLKKDLRGSFTDKKIEDNLITSGYHYLKNKHKVNKLSFIEERIAKLNEIKEELLREGDGKAVIEHIVTEIDIDPDGDSSGLNDATGDAVSQLSDDGKLMTGWQSFNRMIGGGFKRGEFALWAALPHKFKSQMGQSLFMQLIKYNKPHMLDPKKKPLIAYISVEDNIPEIIKFLYEYINMDETGKLASVIDKNPELMASEIKKRLTLNGYHAKIVKLDPSKLNFNKLISVIQGWLDEGYEIHAIILDYLEKVPRYDIPEDRSDTRMRLAVRNLRAFCGPKKITLLTPHQLSVDAKKLLRNGVSESIFVKELPGKGYTSESTQIDQEPDLMWYIHIAKINGQFHLTVQRDRHRGMPNIEENNFFALPFPKIGPIASDIGKKDIGYYPDGEEGSGAGILDF